MYDRTLVNPDQSKVKSEVYMVIQTANWKCKVRLLDPLTFEDEWKQYLTKPEGIFEKSGGPIPPGRNYYDEQGAGTSRIAVAWWTSPAGVVHVRIKGGRVKIRQRSLFGACDSHPFYCIYPDRLFVENDGIKKMRCECGRVGSVEYLTPDDAGRCAICHGLNEYITTTGLIPAVGRKKKHASQ